MRSLTRVATFAAALGVTFGAAALAGAALGPIRPSAGPGGNEDHAGAHETATGMHPEAGHAPRGLAVAEGGYLLAAEATTIPLDRPVDFAFRIIGPGGETIDDFDVDHDVPMHVIVVRRDLTGYQHLHPELDANGRWTVALRLPEAGVYRVYADFSSGGRSITLATDLFVAGVFQPSPLPDATSGDLTAGYRADLDANDVVAGGPAEIAYDISRDGRTVADIEPYLGADGHLVALREGDLAFLHAHPEGSAARGHIRFGATLPTAGRYRLFLQFRHDGRVRTVAHTLEVAHG
jgi:hypothetical protein